MIRVATIGILFASGAAFGADKTVYSWANPTPDELLRPMATDRPDATESPTTVDAGRVQIEMSFAQHTRDRHRSGPGVARTSEWVVAPVNVRLGLTHDTELQVVMDNYIRVKERPDRAAPADRRNGWGDVTLRLKRNLLGNDGGGNALGVMPFVKMPTNTGGVGNDRVEGGLIVPASVTIGGREFGVMTELDLIHDGDGYEAAWFNTVATGFEFTDALGGFVEFASLTGDGPHALTFNTGLTFAARENVQFDAGVNIGVSRAAPDRTLFMGVSVRF